MKMKQDGRLYQIKMVNRYNNSGLFNYIPKKCVGKHSEEEEKMNVDN